MSSLEKLKVFINLKRKQNNELIVDSSRDIHTIYHLAHVRKNIYEWYKIDEESKVLEIGANTGEITEGLFRKTSNLTVIEENAFNRKLIRERINKLYGSSIDISSSLDELISIEQKYDYIFINYLNISKSSEIKREISKYILYLKTFLMPNGKIILLNEDVNEVKFNYIFKGIGDNRNKININNKILEEAVKNTGLSHNVLYPFPSYKFAVEINSGGKDNGSRFYEIANTAEDIQSNKIKYVRLNTRRLKKFQIYTAIQGETVYKMALYDEARAHLDHMLAIQPKVKEYFAKDNYDVIHIEKEEQGVSCEYLDGICYQDYLISLADDKKEVIKAMDQYFSYLKGLDSVESSIFYKDNKFREIFGEIDFKENTFYRCTTLSNIDGNFDNFIMVDDKIILIDFEWVYEVAIPVKFQIWRTLHYFANRNSIINKKSLKAFFKKYEISSAECALFKQMERRFSEYVHGKEKIYHIEKKK